jgi:hypothetical protein
VRSIDATNTASNELAASVDKSGPRCQALPKVDAC